MMKLTGSDVTGIYHYITRVFGEGNRADVKSGDTNKTIFYKK